MIRLFIVLALAAFIYYLPDVAFVALVLTPMLIPLRVVRIWAGWAPDYRNEAP